MPENIYIIRPCIKFVKYRWFLQDVYMGLELLYLYAKVRRSRDYATTNVLHFNIPTLLSLLKSKW